MADTAIELRDIQFSWRPPEAPVLDIPTLEIASGEKVFVAGPSGSGKTTLLNLLGGLTVPQSGQVHVLGQEVTAFSASQRDAFRVDNIGFIFQMFNLMPYLSVVENVTLPCRFSANRRRRATERTPDVETEAERLLSQMGVGSTALGGRTAAELSAGQQQRVAAARAVIGRPPLIIADEPTSSLDADARNAFLELLFAEVEDYGATLIFVSHDVGLADTFDRALTFADFNRAG